VGLLLGHSAYLGFCRFGSNAKTVQPASQHCSDFDSIAFAPASSAMVFDAVTQVERVAFVPVDS
jgi:hypothetical protein